MQVILAICSVLGKSPLDISPENERAGLDTQDSA